MGTPVHLTLEEFLAIPDIDERRLELIDGEVQEKVSPRFGHGEIAIQVGYRLSRVGRASTEARAIIAATASRGASSPIPDIAFYRTNAPERADWMRTPPHVAVEILSPGQSRMEMRAKVDLYLEFGVESVWMIDAERQCVDVYEAGGRRTLGVDETLESVAAPGFSMAVREIFERE